MEGRCVKVVSWYDNEWGYSNRVVELAGKVLEREPGPLAERSRRRASATPTSAGARVLVRADLNVPLDGRRGRRRHPDPGGAADDRAAARARRRGRPGLAPRPPEGPRPERSRWRRSPTRLGELLGDRGRARARRGRRRGRGGRRRASSDGEVLLLENSRCEPGETDNDPELAGGAGRGSPTSTSTTPSAPPTAPTPPPTASPQLLPAYAGLLLEREVTRARPRCATTRSGRSSWSSAAPRSRDKIGVIDRFLEIADAILIGGAMCFSFFRAQGIATGNSLVEEDGHRARRAGCSSSAEASDCELLLPDDLVLGARVRRRRPSVRELDGVEVPDGWMGLDVGPKTAEEYARGDRRAPAPSSGTARWARSSWSRSPPARARSPRRSPRAGRAPSSAAATRPRRSPQFGLADQVDWLSTGGGASLELMEGKELPGVEALEMPTRRRRMSERRPFVAANWKMNKTVGEAEEFLRRFLPRVARARRRRGRRLPAVHGARGGRRGDAAAAASRSPPRTCTRGRAAPSPARSRSPMLLDARRRTASILGHSERRQLFGETDEALARKVPAALEAGLLPILCVGETEAERDARRDRGACCGASSRPTSPTSTTSDLGRVVIAYEPIWAIGTGRTATPEQAEEACAFIRALVAARDAAAGEASGSSTAARSSPATPAELLALRGRRRRASSAAPRLDPEDFAAISPRRAGLMSELPDGPASPCRSRLVALVILDGWGLADAGPGNAVALA